MNNQPIEEQITNVMRNIPEPNPAKESAARVAFLAEARQMREYPYPVWQRPHSRQWMIAAAILIFLIGGFALSVQNMRQSDADATVQAEVIPTDTNPSLHQDTIPDSSQNQVNAPITTENAAQLVELQRFGTGTIMGAVWSPDGSQLAVYGSLGFWLYDSAHFETEPRYIETNTYINDAVYSLDGTSIAYANEDGTVRILDIATGEETLSIKAYEGKATQVYFTDDGATITSGGIEGHQLLVYTWSVETGREQTASNEISVTDEEMTRFFPIPNGFRLTSVEMKIDSPDDVVDTGFVLRVSDVYGSTSVIHTLGNSTFGFTAIAYNGDGNMIAVGDWDNLYLWEGENLRFQLTTPDNQIRAAAFSADGQLLASTHRDGLIQIWDTSSGETLGSLSAGLGNPDYEQLEQIVFSPDGKSLLVLDRVHGLVMIWEWETSTLKATFDNFNSAFGLLSVSSDNQLVVAGNFFYPSLNAWDRTTETPTVIKGTYRGSISDLAFVPNTHWFAVKGRHVMDLDNSITLWDASIMEETSTSFVESDEDGFLTMSGITFNADGSQLVSITPGESALRLTLWDTRSGQILSYLETERSDGPLNSDAAFSPTDNLVAFINASRFVRVWDLESNSERQLEPLAVNQIWAIAFSPDGKTLAALDYGKKLQLWDTTTWQEIAYIPDAGGEYDIAFSSDSQLIAIVGDKGIYLWDVQTHNLVTTLTGHTSRVSQVRFSEDGTLLVTASFDGTVRVWGLQ